VIPMLLPPTRKARRKPRASGTAIVVAAKTG
jgi:hypothetical protein